jgi:hypothetical protein
MYIERIGYIGNKLYRLGWRSAVHQDVTPLQHYLLSIFLYYRRGYASGFDWVDGSCPTKVWDK